MEWLIGKLVIINIINRPGLWPLYIYIYTYIYIYIYIYIYMAGDFSRIRRSETVFPKSFYYSVI